MDGKDSENAFQGILKQTLELGAQYERKRHRKYFSGNFETDSCIEWAYFLPPAQYNQLKEVFK